MTSAAALRLESWIRFWSLHPGRLYTLIFLLALAVRLAFIALFWMPPESDRIWNDAVARNLLAGHGFTASQSEPRIPGVFRTPGYPAFVAAIYYVAGYSYRAVYVVQAVLDSVCAVWIAVILARLWNPRGAVVAGLLYAVYPYAAMFCGLLHQDILLTFSVMAIVLMVTGVVEHRGFSWVRWLAIGLATGAAALVKANMVLFMLLPAGVIWLRRPAVPRRVLAVFLVSVGVGLVTGPWVVRNYMVFGRFPPLAAGGPGSDTVSILNELNGINKMPEAARTYIPRSRDAGAPELAPEFLDGVALIDTEKAILERTLPELKRRWPEYGLMVLKNIPRVWITRYVFDRSSTIAAFAAVSSWVYFLLGIVGMVLLRRHWRQLSPLYLTVVVFTAMYAPYFAEARYTLPARPALLAFGAATLYIALRRWLPGRSSPDAQP